MPNLRDVLKRQIIAKITEATTPTPSQFIAQLRASTAEMRNLETVSQLTGRPITIVPASWDLDPK